MKYTGPDGMKALIDKAIQAGASDLHLMSNSRPSIRVDGRLLSDDSEVLDPETIDGLVRSTLRPNVERNLAEKLEVDYSFGYKNHRFRVNAFHEKGNLSAAFRIIPDQVKSLKELGLPPVLERFTALKQGLVIITGPTGHGKSTTLASMVRKINEERSERIVTVEDPIEYLIKPVKSYIMQREVGGDTKNFSLALRSALREDPNVVLVGEMRDRETMESVLTIAETGHLVFSTLHTNNASQAPDRIVDIFPEHMQSQVRQQLANVLSGIVSQRLIPRVSGGRVVAAEIMLATPAVKALIREGKSHQLPNAIATGATDGMIQMDKVLADYVSRGEINIEDALAWAADPKSFKAMVY